MWEIAAWLAAIFQEPSGSLFNWPPFIQTGTLTVNSFQMRKGDLDAAQADPSGSAGDATPGGVIGGAVHDQLVAAQDSITQSTTDKASSNAVPLILVGGIGFGILLLAIRSRF